MQDARSIRTVTASTHGAMDTATPAFRTTKRAAEFWEYRRRVGAELRRASIVVVAAAAAVALVGAGSFVFAPRTTDEHVYSGRMSPEFPIVVKNLTVGDGRYVIRYAMRVYVAPNPDSVGLVCGVVDTSGRIANLPGMARGVEPGSWVSLDAQGVFELPDLTVGIRCFAEQDATLQVIVRGAVLTATAAD